MEILVKGNENRSKLLITDVHSKHFSSSSFSVLLLLRNQLIFNPLIEIQMLS